MSFFHRLQKETVEERGNLLDNPLVHRAMSGEMSKEKYVAFLCQAFHHVKHTLPLLMAAGARIPEEQEWLRTALAEYVSEELGHQEWILNDISACGYDKEKARNSTPNRATEMMVAYAYYLIDRVDPIGFFGMVHVLEGTSVTVADEAARCIAQSTGLPEHAFSYLTSHGALDVEHVKFFEDLMNKIEQHDQQELIIHCARNFYHLYDGVYSSVSADQAVSLLP